MKNKTILIVDDRPENIFTLENILENSYRTMIKATTGNEAILLASVEDIDVVLLDYQLGDMNGLEVARAMRKNKRTAHIPILFVTALSKSERKKLNEFEPGTVDFIFKPIDIEEIGIKLAVFERMSELQDLLKVYTAIDH